MSKVIAAFGEVLWDLLPDGPALGGAPFNFVYRVAGLGHAGVMISAVGVDDLGDKTVAAVEELGLGTDYLQRKDDFSTGTVNVSFDDSGEPDYEIIQQVAYDHVSFTPDLEALAASVDCVCFGTLAQRSPESRETLTTFLDQAEDAATPLRFLDINLRKDCYTQETITSSLRRADLLKLNDEEARELASMFDLGSTRLPTIAEHLVAQWSLQHCVITLGTRGAFCTSKDGARVYDPGYKIDLVDSCGSGDAFAAGFLHQLLKGNTANDACRFGNILGAIVATQRSATGPIDGKQIDQLINAPPERVSDPDLVSFAI